MTEPTTAADAEAPRWRFGHAVLDERTMELTVRGQKVELARKPLALLMFLVRNPGEVITKDELFEAVWTGRIVTEGTLTTAMGRLRAALGDEDAAEPLIKAVYGYGYRFMAEVVRDDARLPAAATALRGGAMEGAAPLKEGDAVPFRGGWLLTRLLGSGGGGEAWLATETATQATRVFKFARDRDALSALKREITLSRLMRESLGERPDFVRVHDWNLDEPPFFVAVEHCAEGSLCDWAVAHAGDGGIAALSLPQRLELVAQAADALAAAHSVGVLHKDVKPSNLLLQPKLATAEGPGAGPSLQVKLADFGSARLLDRHRLDVLNIAQLGFTQTVVVDATTGTPLYLAPELLAGSPPTTRSDLYALGVVLYQLVVGDLRRQLAPGWELNVDDPLLIEDIALAAAGDPQHRLADAAQLAVRLRSLPARRAARTRTLAERAEAERTRTALDRARARRSLWMALAGVAVLGMSLSFWQYLAARATARESAAVAAFLIDDVFGAADPMKQTGEQLTVKALLDQAAARLATRLPDRPAVRARIGIGLGKAYHAAGAWAAAARQLERALKDSEAAEGPEGPTTLQIVFALADAYDGETRYDLQGRMLQRVVASAPKLGQDHPLVLDSLEALALLDFRLARYAEGAQRAERYLARVTALNDTPRIISAESKLCLLYEALGRYADAERHGRSAIAEQSRLSGPSSPKAEWLKTNLAGALVSAGNTAAALPILEQAESSLIASLGPDHPYSTNAMFFHAKALLLHGDAVAALAVAERAYTVRRRMLGERNFRTHSAASLYGRALTAVGRQQEALPILTGALAGLEAIVSLPHPYAIDACANLVEALLKAGDQARAAQLIDRCRPSADRLPPNFTRFREVEAAARAS